MALTSLIVDAFRGSGTVTGPVAGGTISTSWLQAAGDPLGGVGYTDSGEFTRGSSGLVLTASVAMGSGYEYVIAAVGSATVITGGLISEIGVYGPLEMFQVESSSGIFVGLQSNGDVWVGSIDSSLTPNVVVANIGTITSTTLTIIQVFRGSGSNIFTVKVNGTLVYTSSAGLGLPTLTTGSSRPWIVEVAFGDSTTMPLDRSAGGPFSNASTVIKYIHIATGVLVGTYLGPPALPPDPIYGSSAALAFASATLIVPPKPPDASVSYPFQNFVAWNELTAHTVSLQSARPLKLSLTALGVQTAAALSGDGSKLAVYILGSGDRWLSGGLMDHTPDGWVHLLTLPDRLYASGMPLGIALDGAGRRMVCANSTGWTAFTRDAPGAFFDEQGLISAPAVALGLDARGMTAAVLTSTAVLVYTSATATAPFVLRTSIPLPGTDTWAAMSISGDGMQLIVSGAAHSAVYTRTGEDWNQAATADMLLLLAAINTDGTLATAVEGSLLRTRGLQNARNLTTPLTPEVSTVSGFALTSAVMGLSEASGVFRLITALSRTLPASYGLADGMALLRELPVVRTYESTGDPRFRMAAQPAQNSAPHSGFWQGPSDETA